jgi:hypothetical protein
MERLDDGLVGAGLICSLVSGIGGEPAPPAAFTDPDWIDDRGAPDPLAMHAEAMHLLRVQAEEDFIAWQDGLALAHVKPG